MYCHKKFYTILEKLSIPNGIDWYSNKMYFIDTPTEKINIYDQISVKQTGYIDVSSHMGIPDGMCIANNLAFVAMWDGSQVIVIDLRMNDIIDKIDIPTARPTSVCINNDGLYVTTAYLEPEEYSGFVLRINHKTNYTSITYPFSLV